MASPFLPPPQFESLAEAFWHGYGFRLSEYEGVGGGMDPAAKAFRARTDQGEFFVKVRPAIEPGVELAAFLWHLGIQEVVAPVPTKDGDLGLRFKGANVIVYPFVEGQNGFVRPLDLRHWKEIGVTLNRIHQLELPARLAKTTARETFDVQGVDEFVDLTLQLQSDKPVDEPAKALAAIVEVHGAGLRRFIDEVQTRGAQCRARNWPSVLCHADLHVGNVLVRNDGGINIVDWDQPRIAPRECDLQFFVDGGILGLHGPEEEASFFDGYGPQQPDSELLEYYQRARVLEDLVSFAKQAVGGYAGSIDERMEAIKWFKRQFASPLLPR